jgi:hypothetical protein
MRQSGGSKEHRYSTWQGHEFETLLKKFKNTFKMLSLVFKNSLKWMRHCREGRE